VHHGLQVAADAWSEHCTAVCARLGVPIEVRRVAVNRNDPQGPEAAARAARREAFRAVMGEGDVVVTAHHRDDQAETVLLRLFRGSGIDGLAGMRRLARFPPGRLWRPLLGFRRDELRAYAKREGFDWIEDPQNVDPRYTRSWLRQEVMPLLHSRWPAVDEALARSARHAGEAAALLRELAEIDLTVVRGGSGISVEAVMGLSAPRRRNALRAWLRDHGVGAPSADALARIESEVLLAAVDAQPCLALDAYEVRRYRDTLCLLRALAPPPAPGFIDWSGGDSVELPSGCGRLVASAPPPMPLRIGFPQGGEHLRPGVSTHSRSLKNLFQEAGVPPWIRVRTPLLFRDGGLVAVGDQWLELDFQTTCLRHGWSYRWQRPVEFGDPSAA
jgi:tRNA(Ile)-lysidine synthase